MSGWTLVVLVLGVMGCGGSDADDVPPADTDVVDTPSDDTDVEEPGPAAAHVALTVDGTVGRRVVVASATVALSGRVLVLDGGAPPPAVAWSAAGAAGQSASGSGEVDADGVWTATVAVEPGDNTVTVEVPGSDARVDIAVVRNPSLVFGGPLQLDRDVAYVDEARTLEAGIVVLAAEADVSSVRLVQVDAAGAEVDVGALVDDGDVAQGDDGPRDGVYHARFDVLEAAVGRVSYRVVVELAGGEQARSEVRQVLVAEHLDPADFEAQVAAGRAWRERLEAAGADRAAELARIQGELASDPAVVDLGQGDGGLWFIADNGVATVLGAAAEGEKGAPGAAALRGAGVGEGASTRRGAPRRSARAARDRVGSARVKAIASQYWDWGDGDDVPQMKLLLDDHGCFEVADAFDTLQGGGTVQTYKRLGDYGVVLISTHGDSFFRGVDPFWVDQWGWDGPFGQVVLHSNQWATVGNLPLMEDDLVAGRLVLFYDMYGITPSFIRHYNGRMPSSLVYLSACRGAWDASMAAAFLETGASAVFGYSDYVDVSFTWEHGVGLLEALLEPERTVADAFVPGIVEQDEDPAEFRMFGRSDLALDVEGLQDPGFEWGDLRAAWPGGGLGASVVSVLFGATPTEGARMAMITSGLGDTTPATVSQSFCLASGDNGISFDWNFYSEDRNLGIQPDRFRVSLQAETDVDPFYVYETVLYESHETLNGLLSEAEGAYFTPGCDGCMVTTGWLTTDHAFPAEMRGRRVTMTMAVSQGGGGETAVLVDNLRLTP